VTSSASASSDPGPRGRATRARQSGDRSYDGSFDQFYLREFPGLVALAHVLTGSRTHAEDVAQEAMLSAYQRWDAVGAMDIPAAWARRACANLATSLIRRRIVEARALLRLGSRPAEVAELAYDDGAFWAEVRRLPRRQAQCIALSYVYGCSVSDVAEVLGCAEGTVKVHLSRGRARLAQRLGETDDGSIAEAALPAVGAAQDEGLTA
jgi:RNA polymerase sigma-70 factor (ECF subfamily)